MDLMPSTDFGARDFDGKGGREIHDHLFLGANTGLAAIRGDTETAETPRQVPAGQEGPRRHLRPPRRRRDRRRAARPAPPRGPDARSRAGKYLVEVVVRTLGARPPVQPGDGRLQRDLGRADRQGGRPGHRPLGRDRPGRDGRPVLALHQRLHARPRRQPDRPPQPAGHLRPALQQADPARGRPGRPLRPRGARGRSRARSRSRRRSTTASSTASTWTTSSARGKGPSCRSS